MNDDARKRHRVYAEFVRRQLQRIDAAAAAGDRPRVWLHWYAISLMVATAEEDSRMIGGTEPPDLVAAWQCHCGWFNSPDTAQCFNCDVVRRSAD